MKVDDRKVKRISISQDTYKSLIKIFGNNHKAGEFLTYLVEQTVYELEKQNNLNINIDITKLK